MGNQGRQNLRTISKRQRLELPDAEIKGVCSMKSSKEKFDKYEEKTRKLAKQHKHEFEGAINVFQCWAGDDDSKWSPLFAAIYPDRVSKVQRRLSGLYVEEIPINKISSVEVSGGFSSSVEVCSSGNEIKFEVPGYANEFAEIIRSQITRHNHSENKVSTGEGLTIAEQLEKLSVLLEKGLLTTDEFNQQKRRLLE
jgi:hypothetical protein